MAEAAIYTFNRARFSTMLDQVVKDREFNARLQKQPLAVLRESGFDVRDDIARQIGNKTLVEIQAFDPLGPVAHVAVAVGVDVAVSVVIGVAVHTKAIEAGQAGVINPILRDRVVNEVAEKINVRQAVDRVANIANE
jgi:hypothetical protein